MAVPRYQRFVMETSFKPFKKLDPHFIQATCEHLMTNWQRMAERAEEVAVLLWIGDGSDIYEWHGDLEEEIIWGKFIGFCNYKEPTAYDPKNRHYRINQAVEYMDHPPTMRFKHVRQIISQLRSAAQKIMGKPLLVGATVDPGPEFAHSPFKFKKHPEILIPGKSENMPMHFYTHQAVLKADKQEYAGFPDGIPAGTGFGTFLGKQFASASRDLGFDYIWFSNGFAYTHYPWGFRGELFKGEQFELEKAADQHRKANKYWEDFRAACPDKPIEIRGTNYSVGMDICTDACSHADIARIGKLERPPCNPPWGSRALGLEMTSYLSRIAKTPTDRIPFRFYLNDPWFCSNAWYDHYNRETFDIYTPMSAARINDQGGVDTPTDLALLTIDTEKGELLRDEANEATPHFIRALDERADQAGPIVWVYPFDEYDDTLKRHPDDLPYLFHHDWFTCNAINSGLPVNTVCSSDRFVRLAKKGKLPEAVYYVPVPAGDWAYQQAVVDLVCSGGRAMLYGSLDHASDELLSALGLTLDQEPLEGDFEIELKLTPDRFAADPAPPVNPDPFSESIGYHDTDDPTAKKGVKTHRCLRHRAVVDGGGLRAIVPDWDDPDLRAVAAQSGKKRVYALTRSDPAWQEGRLTWINGTTGISNKGRALEGALDQPWDVLRPADWPRRLLADFGYDIIQERHDEAVKPVYLFIKRHKGGWYFNGHKPDTTVRFWTRTPDGAPVYAAHETPVRDGYAGESFAKTIYNEVRAFVRMEQGTVGNEELPIPVGKNRHFCVTGLVNADVTIYPDPVAFEDGSLWLCRRIKDEKEIKYTVDKNKKAAIVKEYTGAIYVSW